MKISLLGVMFLLLSAEYIRGDGSPPTKPKSPSGEEKIAEPDKTITSNGTEIEPSSSTDKTESKSTSGILSTTTSSITLINPITSSNASVTKNMSTVASESTEIGTNASSSTGNTTSLNVNGDISITNLPSVSQSTKPSPEATTIPPSLVDGSRTKTESSNQANTSASKTDSSNQASTSASKTESSNQANTSTSKTESSNQANTSTSSSPPAPTTQSSVNPDAVESDLYTSSPYLYNNESIEVFYAPVGRDAETPSDHKFVAEKIQNLTRNNPFITNRLINMAADKSQLSHISDPFDVRSIKNWTFENSSFGMGNKLYHFTNITAIPVRALNASSYNNQFMCIFSNHLKIDLDLSPNDLYVEGQYQVKDTISSKTAGGPFKFNQYGGQLSYKVPCASEVPTDSINLIDGDFIYSDGQVKITHACEDQCDILASAADMFNEIKQQVLHRIDREVILKRIAQLNDTFPFMSACLSPPPATPPKHNYYIIDTIAVEKYKSFNLELGPILIKGLDKITRSTILAHKVAESQSPKFTLAFATDRLRGQCDWKFYETGKLQTVTQHSFTFTIDNVTFALDPQFHKTWTLTELQINFGAIDIHRSVKACPKIHEFTKDILRENLRETIVASLTEMFYKQYPKTSPKSSPKSPIFDVNKFKRQTPSRQIVYVNVTKGFGIDENDDEDVSETKVLPFKTRVVPAVCIDNRSWWRRLFSRKKC